MILIGYSGHAFVVCDAFISKNILLTGYCDNEEKFVNPYSLAYFGREDSDAAIEALSGADYFIAIGDNAFRGKVTAKLEDLLRKGASKATHVTAWISPKAHISDGVLVSANASINALASLGKGVIANTGCVIEHECIIGDFAHICPGAVLAGNVTVGDFSFIGANAVVKQGVRIGRNVIVGAGAVIIRDVPDNVCVGGNPARILKELK